MHPSREQLANLRIGVSIARHFILYFFYSALLEPESDNL